jgi:heme/copper-type cytochrome/quinol oxidase subunit 3
MALSDVLGVRGLLGPGVATQAAERVEMDEDRKVRLGMLFYVLSDLMLAFFFFGSYIFLRGYNTNDRWVPPPVAHLIGSGPVTATAWIMTIAVAGGLSYAVGQWALHRELQRIFTWAMVAALVLYFVDLALQVYVMGHQRYDVTDGSFASSFALLAGYHVYHMALGVFLGLGIVTRAFRGLYRRGDGPPRTTGIACIGYFWYYAALYAVAMWLLLLIQPPLPLSA